LTGHGPVAALAKRVMVVVAAEKLATTGATTSPYPEASPRPPLCA